MFFIRRLIAAASEIQYRLTFYVITMLTFKVLINLEIVILNPYMLPNVSVLTYRGWSKIPLFERHRRL